MIYDFHTHSLFSDGVNLPIELIRNAQVNGYKAIAITDHASLSNMEQIIEIAIKDCALANKYWDITAVPGVELTNVPAKSIHDLARLAKECGAKVVVVHGETITEKIEPGTNYHAVSSQYVDLLAHPGLITLEEAKIAAENDVYIEITKRGGHSLSNGHVVKIGRQANNNFLLNSDSHSHLNLYTDGVQKNIARAAGLDEQEAEIIINKNGEKFLKKLKII
jgi:putative hydrolase